MRIFPDISRFDLVFSIGEDCGCAMLLNAAGLRDMSSPFDWLTKATFATRIDLLCSRFEGFLEREDLQSLPKPTQGYVDQNNDYYANRRLDFYYYHDFAAGVPLDESYSLVKAKYDRRIARLLARLDRGGKVLMIWWSRSKRPDDAELWDALMRVQAAYPQSTVCLLAFENDLARPKGVTDVLHLNDRLVKVVGGICPDVNETPGYRPATLRVLRRIRLKGAYSAFRRRWLRMCERFCTLWHFSKAGRKAARARWRKKRELVEGL